MTAVIDAATQVTVSSALYGTRLWMVLAPFGPDERCTP
jgi:hypothetical protein